jgi:6-phosphogluconolactonase
VAGISRRLEVHDRFAINPANGGLTQHGAVSLEAWPVYIATDRTGKFVLSAYYQGGHAAVHPIGEDGSVGGPPIEWLATATGAHAMQTDPTNRYAFVPHIAGNGPNAIFQFRFDEHTGRLTPNSPARVEESREMLGIMPPQVSPQPQCPCPGTSA